MAFLLNKTTFLVLSIIVIILLCWALTSTRTDLKRTRQDLELFQESETLKMEAYKHYQGKIEELRLKVKMYKEKLNDLESNPVNTEWLETTIPSDIDSTLPR